jgi:hypothetical protein
MGLAGATAEQILALANGIDGQRTARRARDEAGVGSRGPVNAISAPAA